jgi:uncharacterized phage infection (PIP) family protein YhgE
MSEYLNIIQQFSKFQGTTEIQIKLLEQKLEELNNKIKKLEEENGILKENNKKIEKLEELNDKMKKLEEENEILKESNKKMVGMPDFSNRKVLKAYDAHAIPNGIKMEEDGWIAASARSMSCWINLSINGMKILNEGLFWSSGGHGFMFVPVQKNDIVKIEGGDYHEITFYPIKK